MVKNFFDFDIPKYDEEAFSTLFKQKNVQIKRVVSNTLSTQREFISKQDEWILLLQGCAKIKMDNKVYKLTKGDTLYIPANTKHTLLKTKKVALWLCIYL